MNALLYALANLARLRWLGAAFCALAIVCATTNVNANAIASGTQHEQTKTRVGGFEQNSSLNVCANGLASVETHREISSAQREAASAFSHAAEEGTSYVFYSGSEAAKAAAMEFAETNGAVVLDLDTVGMSAAESDAFAARASADFAQSASGEVNVFHAPIVDTNSYWMTVERGALSQNPNVTGIVFHIVEW